MRNHELVVITIQQLIEHFKISPESFEYFDYGSKPNMSPSVFWQPKVQLGDCTSTTVDDPNNGHAVVVTFSHNDELICYVFLKAPANLSTNSVVHQADCVISSWQFFPKWRKPYKKFKKLRNLILARDKYKENLAYLKKLHAIFPDTMDEHLFDK